MTLRELFEAEFPVQDGVAWNGTLKTYTTNGPMWVAFINRWIGFQAGYRAAKAKLEQPS